MYLLKQLQISDFPHCHVLQIPNLQQMSLVHNAIHWSYADKANDRQLQQLPQRYSALLDKGLRDHPLKVATH